MSQLRISGRKRPRKRRRGHDDEGRVRARPTGTWGDRSGLVALQTQVGNRAVQRVLAQRQAKEQEKATQAQVEVGEIKIEQPKIEYYEVAGDSLAEVSRQLPPPGKWYQHGYRYRTRTENGVVTRVDVTVAITLRLPRWTGPGWEHASEFEKLEWLRMLGSMGVEQKEGQDVTKLPQRWLLGPDWEKAPDAVKGEWRGMLQGFQAQEQSYIDIARRRALVLQQRLLNRPEAQIKAIYDQFIKDLKIEQEAYNRQMQFGEQQEVSLGANVMIQ